MVTVVILGLTLRDAIGESELEVELAQPTTIKEFLAANQDRLGALMNFLNNGEVLITVNRKIGALSSMVKDGDTVKFAQQSNQAFEGARWHNP
ncbi:MAG TPA: MoaD/ThiS family protein [Nitrospiraceae bacterium]|nr:MoaD/ThiS family protein [Nitrospiraceae bacterium]